jgi:hypothetical protein
MVALGMTGFVIGLALALRFRVFVLLPVEGAALTTAVLAMAAGHTSWLVILLAFTTFSVSTQIGYAVSLSVPVLWRARLRQGG